MHDYARRHTTHTNGTTKSVHRETHIRAGKLNVRKANAGKANAGKANTGKVNAGKRECKAKNKLDKKMQTKQQNKLDNRSLLHGHETKMLQNVTKCYTSDSNENRCKYITILIAFRILKKMLKPRG